MSRLTWPWPARVALGAVPVLTVGGLLVQPMTGFDADHSYSGTTGWDPFTSREVVVWLHCASETDHAVVEDHGPSPF